MFLLRFQIPLGKLKTKLVDVNGDGVNDLNFVVWTKDLRMSNGSGVAALNARTFDGKTIRGEQKLQMVEFTADAKVLAGRKLSNSTTKVTRFTPDKDPNHIDSGTNFLNSATITIIDGMSPPTAATPYPSTITASGIPTGGTYRISVVIRDFRHTFPDDVDMLLVGPSGVKPPQTKAATGRRTPNKRPQFNPADSSFSLLPQPESVL